jgi:hypothetical protein
MQKCVTEKEWVSQEYIPLIDTLQSLSPLERLPLMDKTLELFKCKEWSFYDYNNILTTLNNIPTDERDHLINFSHRFLKARSRRWGEKDFKNVIQTFQNVEPQRAEILLSALKILKMSGQSSFCEDGKIINTLKKIPPENFDYIVDIAKKLSHNWEDKKFQDFVNALMTIPQKDHEKVLLRVQSLKEKSFHVQNHGFMMALLYTVPESDFDYTMDMVIKLSKYQQWYEKDFEGIICVLKNFPQETHEIIFNSIQQWVTNSDEFSSCSRDTQWSLKNFNVPDRGIDEYFEDYNVDFGDFLSELIKYPATDYPYLLESLTHFSANKRWNALDYKNILQAISTLSAAHCSQILTIFERIAPKKWTGQECASFITYFAKIPSNEIENLIGFIEKLSCRDSWSYKDYSLIMEIVRHTPESSYDSIKIAFNQLSGKEKLENFSYASIMKSLCFPSPDTLEDLVKKAKPYEKLSPLFFSYILRMMVLVPEDQREAAATLCLNIMKNKKGLFRNTLEHIYPILSAYGKKIISKKSLEAESLFSYWQSIMHSSYLTGREEITFFLLKNHEYMGIEERESIIQDALQALSTIDIKGDPFKNPYLIYRNLLEKRSEPIQLDAIQTDYQSVGESKKCVIRRRSYNWFVR